ncbi:unnamed protein product [Blepharisma stoltei]|uniref:TFIIS N-terminal domain-containing protein n=1 Tax=Blepharisma stoltei TaxID=1481888 RepID=A0AAU9I9K6_9CILI|nr:unnamed protein product [Blepharisma stoltei]
MNPSSNPLDELLETFKNECESYQKEFKSRIDSSAGKLLSKIKEFYSKLELSTKAIPKKPKNKPASDEESESDSESPIPKKRPATSAPTKKKPEAIPHKPPAPQKKRKADNDSEEESYDSSKLDSLIKPSNKKVPEPKEESESEESEKSKQEETKEKPKEEKVKNKTEDEPKPKPSEDTKVKIKVDGEPKTQAKKESEIQNEKEKIFDSEGDESSENSIFGTEDEGDEDVKENKSEEDTKMDIEEKFSYSTLTLSFENVKKMIDDIGNVETTISLEILDTLERLFISNPSDYSYKILVDTKLPTSLLSYCKTVENEAVKDKGTKLVKSLKETYKRFIEKEPAEDWGRLKKRLDEAIAKASDVEILAQLRRVGDSFPEKIIDEMKPLMSTINKLSKDSRNSEIQTKASSLCKKWREKIAKPEGPKEDIRKVMDEKVNFLKNAGHKVLSADEENSKSIKTVDSRKTVPQGKGRR